MCCAYCGLGGIIDWRGQVPTFESYDESSWWEGVLSPPFANPPAPRLVGLYKTWVPAHLDHVIPESRNGPTSLDNTVISCPLCNLAKGDSAFGDPGFAVWLEARRRHVESRHALDVMHPGHMANMASLRVAAGRT